jgi:hypothetical protein
MKAFLKSFIILTIIYFLFIVHAHLIPIWDLKRTGFESFAYADEKVEDPPDIPPVIHSPVPADTIIYLPDGRIIIIMK